MIYDTSEEKKKFLLPLFSLYVISEFSPTFSEFWSVDIKEDSGSPSSHPIRSAYHVEDQKSSR